MPWFKLCVCEVKFKGAGETPALRKPDTGPELCTSGWRLPRMFTGRSMLRPYGKITIRREAPAISRCN